MPAPIIPYTPTIISLHRTPVCDGHTSLVGSAPARHKPASSPLPVSDWRANTGVATTCSLPRGSCSAAATAASIHHLRPFPSPLQNGKRALHFAAEKGLLSLIDMFLANGADVDMKNNRVAACSRDAARARTAAHCQSRATTSSPHHHPPTHTNAHARGPSPPTNLVHFSTVHCP